MRGKLAERLRLEREVPQGEGRRHYVLAAGAGELVDDDEGDEDVWLARRGDEEVRLARRGGEVTPLTGSSSSSELPSSSAGSSSAVAASSAVVEASAALSPAAGECT